MPRGNPDSKRGQVRSAFQQDGPDGAAKKAAELGIPDSKLKRWLGMWGLLAPEAKPSTPDANGEEAVLLGRKSQKVREARKDPANRIRWKGSRKGYPHRLLGTVVDRGPEQSWVIWANGNEDCVPNHWFIGENDPEPEEEPVKRRRLKKG